MTKCALEASLKILMFRQSAKVYIEISENLKGVPDSAKYFPLSSWINTFLWLEPLWNTSSGIETQINS